MSRIYIQQIAAVLMVSALALCSCKNNNTEWSDPQSWYQSENEFDADKIDVLYLVSTEVVSATDKDGNPCWQSRLIDEDLDAINGEIAWVEKNMFYDDFNVIAPLYHQLTFTTLTQLPKNAQQQEEENLELFGVGGRSEFNLPDTNLEDVYQDVVEEVCDAFDYYMENQNGGRPFIIAGFSQGAMLALDLLVHMTDEQYSRMIACYTLGYRLSAEDLRIPHIKAATGEGDTGVVISFNSTQTREAIWPLVSADAATCINPLNWKTDSTPATFEFNGTTNTIHIDPETNVLLVDTDDPEYYYSFYELAPFFLDAGVNKDNLHHWDLMFYPGQIHDNALVRAGNAK
ncbi:MAG: DUF3089 domain-containing protein [Bacteroidales bacterium]|nr:DUF3089 domain-containing protein [Candidatus Cryptobacteroides caccocaballi]